MARASDPGDPIDNTDLGMLHKWLGVTAHVLVVCIDVKGAVVATICHGKLGADDPTPTAEGHGKTIEDAITDVQDKLGTAFAEALDELDDEEEEEEEEEDEDEKD